MQHSILIVEDDTLLLQLLSAVFRRAGLHVVAEARSLHEADAAIAEHRPSLVVLDLVLRGGDAVTRIAAWKIAHPDMRIMVLSAHSDDSTLYQLNEVGITVHLMKHETNYNEVLTVAKLLLGGKHVHSRHISAAVVRIRRDCFSRLTNSERGMIELLGLGFGDDKVAKEFSISENTARTHRANIMRKMGLRSRTELMWWAFQHGFTRRRLALAALRPVDSPDWPERAA